MFFALEDHIVRRLQAKVPGVRAVRAARDLADLKETAQGSPELHVIFGSYSVPQSTAGGVQATVRQTWYIVCAVRHAGQRDPGALLRAEADPIINAVLKSMTGWRADLGVTRFNLAPAPPPAYSPSYAYFPLAFTTELSVTGQPDD